MPGTLAERLGFGAEERVAVVHADDLGLCHAANAGALEALSRGPVTCGSVMVPCPWFPEAAAIARERPELDLGVHWTLNAEFEAYRWAPVAGRSAVPSLVDDEGYLHRSVEAAMAKARPEEVELELRAQLERALAAGIDVTHVDTHMGTLFAPPFQEAYVRVAREHDLPLFAVRADAAMLRANRLPEALLPAFEALAERTEAAGLPVLDGFDQDSLEFGEGEGDVHNRTRIARLRRGVSYLICHPARRGDELERVCPHQALQRDFERRFYGSAEGAAALAEQEIRTVGMRALRDLVRKEASGAQASSGASLTS